MILSNRTIRDMCTDEVYMKVYDQEKPMIVPFEENYIYGGMSGGLSISGYDVRLDQDVTLYPVSLKNLILKALGFKRPSFLLASTMEQFHIPARVMPFIVDKSTWARRGLAVQNTTAEAGWSGYLTLELSNHSDEVIKIKKGTPIAQMVFHSLNEKTEGYSGKYNHQKRGPQRAILV